MCQSTVLGEVETVLNKRDTVPAFTELTVWSVIIIMLSTDIFFLNSSNKSGIWERDVQWDMCG